MKTVHLIHNPGAGEGTHSQEELSALLEKSGFECRYFSTKKKGWKEFGTDADLLAIAGGDGTVRKVAGQLLKRKLIEKPHRIAILPAGTANNIATSLGIGENAVENIRAWKKAAVKPFDVGRLMNLQDHGFFLESFGCGVFPRLIREMKKFDVLDDLSPDESLNEALKNLHRIILSYEPRRCRVIVDGKSVQGNFILAEVLNIPMIGPNLRLSPGSDPRDGVFEVLLVTEEQRSAFARHVASHRHGKRSRPGFRILRGSNIDFFWEGDDVHVDDSLVKEVNPVDVRIRINPGTFNILVP